jgi:hypothetical protein
LIQTPSREKAREMARKLQQDKGENGFSLGEGYYTAVSK